MVSGKKKLKEKKKVHKACGNISIYIYIYIYIYIDDLHRILQCRPHYETYSCYWLIGFKIQPGEGYLLVIN